MSDDVSRETETPVHDDAEHERITQQSAIQMYDPATKTLKPTMIEYRADGCITARRL